MAKIEVYLPAMGEGIREATITRWLKKEGDEVSEDESIVEVATDKVDSEIPSPADGTIVKLLFKEGDSPQVGSIIALIVTGIPKDEYEITDNFLQTESEQLKTVAKVIPDGISTEQPVFSMRNTPDGRFLSPLVRSIAEKESITAMELDSIAGTGKDNRITKADLLNFLKDRIVSKKEIKTDTQEIPDQLRPTELSAKITAEQRITTSYGGDIEIVEMDRMRKLIAENMLHSKHISPHVTTFVEIDVSNMVAWREKAKNKFYEREKEKLTYTPLFVEAAVKAIKDFPMINVSVDGAKIIVKKNINIGIATALPSGNLIVPVIKNADRKNLTGLAKSVNDLARRARKNKLVPEEIMGGTFTITNFGTFGNLTGTPIINQPEVAIFGAGAIVKKPAVVTTQEGDFIAIRSIMIISLSFDHRVVDGALGGQFLRKLGDYLENWDMLRTI
jgi:2-oxoglutarate dehydrogenase E2 component (dihydrolipoamide succinyltransferase)